MIFHLTFIHVYFPLFQFYFDRTIRIYASIEESMKGTSSGLCTIQVRGLDIKNVEPGFLGLGRSDPFFELSRKNADHAAGVVRWYVYYIIELDSDDE